MKFCLQLDGRSAERLAHTEYCSNETLMHHVTGLDADIDSNMNPNNNIARAFNEEWDIDFIWSVNDGPVPWTKRGLKQRSSGQRIVLFRLFEKELEKIT
jgi:hypothetical protein